MSAAWQTWLVLRREVRLETSSREAAVMTLPYVAGLLLLAGLGLDARSDLLVPLAPTLTWVAVLTVAAPLSRVASAAEHDDGTWDLIRGLALPGAVLGGKVMFLWLVLATTWASSAMGAVVLMEARWSAVAVLAGLMGTLGLALTTTAVGVLVGGVSRRAGLLAALLVPTGVPVLVAGTQVASGEAVTEWLTLLGVYDALLLVTVWALTPLLMEE